MAVKTLLETLDDVPESLHSEYKEQEIPGLGKRFVLDIEGVEAHPLVRNLKTAHDSVKTKRDEYKAQLDEVSGRIKDLPGDFTVEEYLRLKQAEADGKGPNVDQRLKDLRDELDRKRVNDIKAKDTEIETREARIGFLTNTIQKRTVDDGLTNALVEVGVSKGLLSAARAMLKERGVVHFVEENGQFTAVAKTDTLGDVDVMAYVKEWAKTDEGKEFVPKATGGGAQGSGPGARNTGENPFSDQHWNVTRQGQIYNEKGAAYADSLAKQAGTTVGGPRPVRKSASA